MLEKDFLNTCDYVELSSHNYSTISIMYVKLILQIGAEIDNVFKVICNLTGRKNINDYVNLILTQYSNITNQQVEVSNNSILLQPFKNWNKDEPSKSLLFWCNYNCVKHDRILNFSKASLESTLNALSALFILEMYLINDIYLNNDDMLQNIPEHESNLFVLNDWKYHIRPSKATSHYEVYDDDDGSRIL